MKQLYTFLFAICCIPIVLCSCAKKKIIPVDTALQQAYSFPVGSYWVYKDSLSGDIDSFFVTSNGLSSYETDDNITDRIGIYISEVSKYRSPIEQSQWQILLSSSRIYMSLVSSVTAHYVYDPVQYPFVANTNSTGGYGSATVTGILISYTIENNTFNKVAIINDTLLTGLIPVSGGYPPMNDWLYLADGIGIIKMRLYHPLDTVNRVWELQRWNTSGRHQR